ncbi:dephospho-CoA kinase domain-containing protein [Caerostris extrusa]|uniref:Dephospho-CoA kinase domain-containing protein n=1 Tax=Caerostris extrusa TaxID=172846 RepID=A0AAV4XGT7_CAEEX|nr:dephospho-CoA kinase domain-containing protein [Caerostris extrusa]
MFLVGLTGGIASGKSSVSTLLRNMGIEIIDADIIAREVVEPGKKAWRKIREEFGEAVFHPDGTLNRPALGQVVFSQPEKRRILNSITHPEVFKSMFFRAAKLFLCGHQFAVVDVPLLYESGKLYKYVHKTVVVVCEPAQQLERLMARDKVSESEALARINAQMPLAEKAKMADFVISNTGDRECTKEQVEALLTQLRALKTHWKYRFIFLGSILVTVSVIGVGPYILYKFLKQ